MTFTLKHIFPYYKSEGGTLDKQMFKNIVCDYNIHIMNHLVYDAGHIDMANLSRLKVGRIKRAFTGKLNKSVVDWKASNEYKQELLDAGIELYDHKTGKGKRWLIYNDSEWYCRFYWNKQRAKATHKTVYRFVPTRGEKGNKEKLKEHLYENEINYLKYPIL